MASVSLDQCVNFNFYSIHHSGLCVSSPKPLLTRVYGERCLNPTVDLSECRRAVPQNLCVKGLFKCLQIQDRGGSDDVSQIRSFVLNGSEEETKPFLTIQYLRPPEILSLSMLLPRGCLCPQIRIGSLGMSCVMWVLLMVTGPVVIYLQLMKSIRKRRTKKTCLPPGVCEESWVVNVSGDM